jgi:hypothetical protein
MAGRVLDHAKRVASIRTSRRRKLIPAATANKRGTARTTRGRHPMRLPPMKSRLSRPAVPCADMRPHRPTEPRRHNRPVARGARPQDPILRRTDLQVIPQKSSDTIQPHVRRMIRRRQRPAHVPVPVRPLVIIPITRRNKPHRDRPRNHRPAHFARFKRLFENRIVLDMPWRWLRARKDGPFFVLRRRRRPRIRIRDQLIQTNRPKPLNPERVVVPNPDRGKVRISPQRRRTIRRDLRTLQFCHVAAEIIPRVGPNQFTRRNCVDHFVPRSNCTNAGPAGPASVESLHTAARGKCHGHGDAPSPNAENSAYP